MQTNRKSVLAAKELGETLRHRRKELGLTLEQLASKIDVDVGQLSRFERAEFKIVSQNLQKATNFLQIPIETGTQEPDSIVEQFAELLGRSARHRAAAIALVRALQELR
ncbi:helix-turn-helix domain-containing protein [Burkholderia gladioli]|uniref:helix-turn-helix domain-containing protein n=1 Tax=Burkholderia gladioli TaxID=28095 RepID=UPI00163EC8D0|nr:helix-turn-helix transcriptional regulator [Burkholderia gladioli]